MVALANTAEGGTADTAVTTGNSGGTSGTAWTSVGTPTGTSATYSTAAAYKGSLGYNLAQGSGTSAGATLNWNVSSAAPTLRVRFYFRASAFPTGNILCWVTDGANATPVARVGLTTSGKFLVQNAAGSTLFTDTATLPTSTWVRVELIVVAGTTSSNGTIRFAWYVGDSATASGSYASTAVNTGTAGTFSTLAIGKLTGTWNATTYFDDLAADDGSATSFMGPSAASAIAATTAGSLALGGLATGVAAALSATANGSVNLGGLAKVYVAPVIPLPSVISPQSTWTWSVGPWRGLPTRQLVSATSRSCKLRLTGTSEVTFTIDGTSDDAGAVQEMVSDLWVMRNGVTLYRGRVGGSTDTLDGTKHTVAVTTGDYRALLARRYLLDADTLTYTTTDAAAIGSSLLSTTQGHAGGGLNITDGSTPIGTQRAITYPAGQSIGQAIEQLSRMDAGWNWDIVPTTGQVGQVYTTWTSRGEGRGKLLDYPGRVASVTRTVDPGNYANSIRETGNTGLAAVAVSAPDVATRPEGLWEAQLGDTSLLDAASVTSRANYDLAQRQQIAPAYQVKLYPGSWGGPLDVWLGDVVELRVQSGRLNVDDFLQVWEVDIDLDDADNETVTLTLSDLDPFKRARSRQVEFRLQSLERR